MASIERSISHFDLVHYLVILFLVFEIQDDPVAHSIHYNKFLHDLHLHDYKSFSRLTDVSYDDVIKSDDFAVILFTLECKRYSFIKALGFRLYYFVYSSSSSLLRICLSWICFWMLIS